MIVDIVHQVFSFLFFTFFKEKFQLIFGINYPIYWHNDSIINGQTTKGTVIEKVDMIRAVKEAKIREAQGEAEAILVVQKALADSITLLNEANPTPAVLTLKSYEAFEKAADGKATKIIVPSEIQSLAGLAASFKGLLEDEKK